MKKLFYLVVLAGILQQAQASNNHQCPIGCTWDDTFNECQKDGVSCGKRTKDCPIGCVYETMYKKCVPNPNNPNKNVDCKKS